MSQPPGGNFNPLYVPLSRQWPKWCGKMNVFSVDVVSKTEEIPVAGRKNVFSSERRADLFT